MTDASEYIGEDEEDATPAEKKAMTRDTELGRRKRIEGDLLDLYQHIDKAFIDAATRINDQMDYWDIYNCNMGQNQFYQGNASIYVPLVRDAIDARVTRFTNQVFPGSGRNVEIITTDADLPFEQMALMEHYVRTSKLRTLVIPALLRNGDIEGQWNLYVSWNKSKRTVSYKVKRGEEMDGIEVETDEPTDDIKEEEIPAMSPMVEVIPDSDVMVLPHTADSIDEALARGGSVTILRRWTKADIKRMIKEGEFISARAKPLIEALSKDPSKTDAKKKHVDAAGIQGGGKFALGYEVWTMLEVDGEKTLCRAYFGGADIVLGCKRNPYWSDLCPLISAPLDKISGVFKGTAPVKKVATFQYQANDWMNQGADSATYALMPIVMTDPIRNPRVGSMVMDLAAVWEVDPNSTKFAEFPPLWKDAMELVGAAKSQVFQSLGVNPSMIPGAVGGKGKKNQAEIANEQQVDVLTTADVVINLEGSVLNEVLSLFSWLDAQFRDDAIVVKMYGRAGMKAVMQEIEPIQMNTRYEYVWLGVEAARSSQQVQQQIAAVNVLNGIPPEKMPGKKLNLAPFAERLAENAFGPRLAPLILEDIKDSLSVPAEFENSMLLDGFDIPVSPLDDDAQHMHVHQPLMNHGDLHGTVRLHLMKHAKSMMEKQQAQAGPPPVEGVPGKPGGVGPGVAGTPKPGAVPAGPHAAKSPNGAIHRDQMPMSMPRKM